MSTNLPPNTDPGFWASFAYPYRGLGRLLGTPRLWKRAALPFLVNIVLYTALLAGFYALIDRCLLGEGSWIEGWWPWLQCAVAGAAFLVGLALLAFTFTVVGGIVAGPLLDFLAERLLSDLRGTPLPRGGPWVLEALRAIGRKLATFSLFLLLHLALLVLLLIPLVNLLYPPLSLLLTVVFLAYDYLDYPLAADRKPFGDRLGYLFRHFRSALGFGFSLFLLLLIPIVSYAALPACVVGATLLHHDRSPLSGPIEIPGKGPGRPPEPPGGVQ